ncbi:MAG: hypothetical protein GXO29_02675 [Thermotogae bacterium]|nr:hypothetical protein [Thermotogota bacterium]
MKSVRFVPLLPLLGWLASCSSVPLEYYGADIPDSLNLYVGFSLQDLDEIEMSLEYSDNPPDIITSTSGRVDVNLGAPYRFVEGRINAGLGLGTIYSKDLEGEPKGEYYFLQMDGRVLMRAGYSFSDFTHVSAGIFADGGMGILWSKPLWDLAGIWQLESSYLLVSPGVQLLLGIGSPERITLINSFNLWNFYEVELRVVPLRRVPLILAIKAAFRDMDLGSFPPLFVAAGVGWRFW